MKRHSLFLSASVFIVLLICLPSLNTSQDTEAIDGSENGIGEEATADSESISTIKNENDEIVTGTIFSVSILLT